MGFYNSVVFFYGAVVKKNVYFAQELNQGPDSKFGFMTIGKDKFCYRTDTHCRLDDSFSYSHCGKFNDLNQIKKYFDVKDLEKLHLLNVEENPESESPMYRSDLMNPWEFVDQKSFKWYMMIHYSSSLDNFASSAQNLYEIKNVAGNLFVSQQEKQKKEKKAKFEELKNELFSQGVRHQDIKSLTHLSNQIQNLIGLLIESGSEKEEDDEDEVMLDKGEKEEVKEVVKEEVKEVVKEEVKEVPINFGLNTNTSVNYQTVPSGLGTISDTNTHHYFGGGSGYNEAIFACNMLYGPGNPQFDSKFNPTSGRMEFNSSSVPGARFDPYNPVGNGKMGNPDPDEFMMPGNNPMNTFPSGPTGPYRS